MKSKLEILAETVKYYSEDPKRRAVTPEGGCEYKTNDGRMCAVGRFLRGTLPVIWSGVINHNNAAHLESVLKPEYRGHSIDFWVALQELHDTSKYWQNDGLTAEGKNRVVTIMMACLS